MKAQQLRLNNRTKEPNVRKGISNVLMNYIYLKHSIARIDFIIAVARIHFKTNLMNEIVFHIT